MVTGCWQKQGAKTGKNRDSLNCVAFFRDSGAVSARLRRMPRRSRCILPGLPCHVTQRGSRPGRDVLLEPGPLDVPAPAAREPARHPHPIAGLVRDDEPRAPDRRAGARGLAGGTVAARPRAVRAVLQHGLWAHGASLENRFGSERLVREMSEHFGRCWRRGRPKKEAASAVALEETANQFALF